MVNVKFFAILDKNALSKIYMNNIFIIFVGTVYWAWALLSTNPKLFFCIYMRDYYTLLVY